MTHGVIMTGIVIKKIKNWRRLTNISQFVGIVHTVDRKRVVNQLLIERTDRISFFLGTWGCMHFTFYLIIITYAAVNPSPRTCIHARASQECIPNRALPYLRNKRGNTRCALSNTIKKRSFQMQIYIYMNGMLFKRSFLIL